MFLLCCRKNIALALTLHYLIGGFINNLSIRTLSLTVFALLAFAGNSVLCRMALAGQSIDAGSFTFIRLVSGLFVLMVLLKALPAQNASSHGASLLAENQRKGSWLSAFLLFLYAVTFSYAYISLDTGIGALILFGAVQLTMVIYSVVKGARLNIIEWFGLLVAFTGFVYLVMPTLTTPSLHGFLLMLVSGVAWAFYTLRGKASSNPLVDTSYNFVRTAPWLCVLLVGMVLASRMGFVDVYFTSGGIVLAAISGGVASGLGYAVWYMALAGLSSSRAAVVQLLVPIIASLGGVLFAGELMSMRLIISSLLVLGGILMVVLGHQLLHRKAIQ